MSERKKPLFKRLLQSDALRGAACWIGAQYIRLVRATGRWHVEGGELPNRLWDEGKPFILAFWHGRLLMMPYSWRRGMRMHMLISQHRDGELIARTIGHFDLGTVRGSAAKPGKQRDKGGMAAMRAMARALAQGEYVGITPDGPRGPRMRASEGIVALARLSGAPVIPAAYATSNRKVLSTWDRFVIALPFSRGVFVWGKPIHVAKDAKGEALESARLAVENELNAVTARADMLVGRPVIEPEPLGNAGQPA
jgi:lysophospholipid acyltransferase (LPLAT)-like uncharacterized protein